MFIIFQVGFRIWILVFDAIFDQTVIRLVLLFFSAILVFIRTWVLTVFRVAVILYIFSEILLKQFCCRKKAFLTNHIFKSCIHINSVFVRDFVFLFATDLYQNQHCFHFFTIFARNYSILMSLLYCQCKIYWFFSRNTTINRLLDIIFIYKLTVNVIFNRKRMCLSRLDNQKMLKV